ncbi:MAG: helix-turn-helix domain-containing protein [Verrucomicrobia bacterium]|nr:helix-turn-helix domain-containing protein [Verrucomicrobiota bacterium]
MNDPEHRQLLEELSRSRIFEDYQKAFSEATGLPLALRPVEAWHPVQKGNPRENPFCALMAKTSRTCAACLQVQDQLTGTEAPEPRNVTCFAGLTDTAIPLRFGEALVGYLQTGQAFVGASPDPQRFTRVARQIMDWGLKTDLSKLEEAWFHSQVLDPTQYEAAVRLLGIFAQHLAIIGNQLMVRERHAEPPAVTRARQFIADHQAEAISLGDVSRAVNMSSFYFCKVFKKATGLKFTDYLSRVRIERAKNLLLNPNVRITEVAYEVGFQTLTHFNRVFRKVVGESPSAFRHRLPTREAA